MAIGPFSSFAFPGVYTQTLNEPPTVGAAGALRFPAFIGVGDEVIPVTAYEMIRGSSAMADNKITREDVSSQITGTNRNFHVSFYPITNGIGSGTVSTDPRNVTAYVNYEPVPVASINATNGIVYLLNAPSLGDVVEITYFYKRTDTLYPNEDLSIQADGVNVTFKVDNVPIVSGNNGGVTTTDPTKITVTVNATAVIPTVVDGDNGLITLPTAPALGATVLVTYYSNEWQDTYDILPTSHVNSITRVGYNSNSTDFIDTVDYVLNTTGQFNTLNWGNSYKISYGAHTAGSDYFYSQISGTLFDNHSYRRQATGLVDGTNRSFVIEAVPTNGSGLAKATDNPALLSAYVGTSPTSAADATILELSAASKTITLQTAPVVGRNVYVTQYQNMLPDDTWTMLAISDGTYSISGANSGQAYNITQNPNGSGPTDTTVADPDFATENVTYPAGTGAANSDGQVMPGYGVAEMITVEFIDSKKYGVYSSVSNGTGSSGDNTGYLNQTYVDKKTGFRTTILQGAMVAYQAADKIRYNSATSIKTGALPTRAVPGIKVFVTDTAGITASDTGILTTYNKSGAEPNIGDFYYVSFLENKLFNEDMVLAPVFVVLEKDALTYSGTFNINNRLGLAAHLAFLNGAPAMALCQVQRGSGQPDAPDTAYIKAVDVFNIPLSNGLKPALMEPVTTSTAVLSYVKTSNTIQSSIRYANERMTYFGFANNTSPSTAMVYAQSMFNERMTGIYPDGGIVTLTDELGNNTNYVVDGSFLAAAVAGRDTSPAFDVAEPLTRKPVVGFTRLFRTLDPVTQAQVCNAGLTLLEQQPAGILVKMDLTTDLTSVLTRTPSVIRIKDYVQQGARSALASYIGQKYLPDKITAIQNTLKTYLGSVLEAKIIAGIGTVSAIPDPNEPTTVQVTASYSPVLPLLWIIITFNLRSSV